MLYLYCSLSLYDILNSLQLRLTDKVVASTSKQIGIHTPANDIATDKTTYQYPVYYHQGNFHFIIVLIKLFYIYIQLMTLKNISISI